MVTLERVSLANLDRFKRIRLRALQDSPKAFGSTYAREVRFTDAEWRARVERWNGERGIGYLAIDGERECGIAGGLADEEDSTHADLVSMWTDPAHRQAGVGRLLVEAVIEWARLRGVLTLRLMVTSTNDAAAAFYQRLGFAMTGRTEPYANDPDMVEREMARSI